MGGSRARVLTRSQRVSSRRFRQATGWAPHHPNVREGWPAVVAALDAGRPDSLLARLALLVLGAGGLMVGLWAQLSPRSFYDGFPGGGRHWVSVDGPYNQHLVRDVGGLNLALALVTLTALVVARPVLVRAVAVAWLLYSVPHFAYHATHLDPYGPSDQVASMAALAVNVVLPVLLLVTSRPRRTRHS
jgi:hypothetical protein